MINFCLHISHGSDIFSAPLVMIYMQWNYWYFMILNLGIGFLVRIILFSFSRVFFHICFPGFTILMTYLWPIEINFLSVYTLNILPWPWWSLNWASSYSNCILYYFLQYPLHEIACWAHSQWWDGMFSLNAWERRLAVSQPICCTMLIPHGWIYTWGGLDGGGLGWSWGGLGGSKGGGFGMGERTVVVMWHEIK